MILLIIAILACVADAITTNALIARGGVEKVSAWVISKHPEPWKVWAWCALMPAAVLGWLHGAFQGLWWVSAIVIVARTYVAVRNHRLMR